MNRARMRGTLAGAVALVLAAVALLFALVPGGPGAGAMGQVLASLPAPARRLLALGLAAALCGAVSSAAARDYVSGTSVLATSLGLLLYGLMALGVSTQDLLQAQPLELALEVLGGLGLLLCGYTAAWQTDLRWTLPRRPGPAYVAKVVGARELGTRNLPALALCTALAALGALPLVALVPPGGLALLAWILGCAVAAALAGRLFPVRSTFFLWIAPGLAVLLALALRPETAGTLAGMAAGYLAPAGALGAVLGSLAVPARR